MMEFPNGMINDAGGMLKADGSFKLARALRSMLSSILSPMECCRCVHGLLANWGVVTMISLTY